MSGQQLGRVFFSLFLLLTVFFLLLCVDQVGARPLVPALALVVSAAVAGDTVTGDDKGGCSQVEIHNSLFLSCSWETLGSKEG